MRNSLIQVTADILEISSHCWSTWVHTAGLLEFSSHCWSSWVQFALLICLRSVHSAGLLEFSFIRVDLALTVAPPQLSVCYSSTSVIFFPCIISPLCHLPLEDWPNLAGTETILKIIPLWIFNVSYNHYPMLRYSLSCCPSFQIGVCV